MNIYIDFDDTLSNTVKFKQDLDFLVKKYNIKEDLNSLDAKENNKDYCYFKIIKKLTKLGVNVYQNYLYNDSIDFLKALKAKKYVINILTRGPKVLQTNKIKASGILEYVDNIIIVNLSKRKAYLPLDFQNSIFIDDNPRELKSLLRKKPYKVIRIERKGNPYNEVVIEGIESYNKLKDVVL